MVCSATLVVVVDSIFYNIKGLVQVRDSPTHFLKGKAMAELPVLSDAFLILDEGKILDYGPMSSVPAIAAREHVDLSGRFVFPSFVDSHTHIVFAGSREEEFVMKIKGASYAEIAAQGGGILNSAKRLQATPEEELFQQTLPRINEVIQTGTGVLEIKSGYGLTLQDELKMLRVARRIGRETPLTVKTTFLGAHAVPAQVSKEEYINSIVSEMIPVIAREQLADYIDVFCEEGFYTPEETIRIGEAGKAFGLTPRLHANQLHRSGGVQAGIKLGAISVDHLENIGDEEIQLLKDASVIPTALPGAAFFLGLSMPPARHMIDAGVGLAIASDFNPGSSPSGNMPLMISLACIKMKMTPEEAINAATINTACALNLQDNVGSITRGKTANIFITKPIPSVHYFPYAYGSLLVDKAYLNGKAITR